MAWSLMALCVVIHAAGLTAAFHRIRKRPEPIQGHFWAALWMLVVMAGWTLFLHLCQIAVWAFFYVWKGALPDLQSSFYFSAITYTTTGYGDVVLPEAWHLIGGVEALTGILMCGLSTGFFFAVFSKIFALGHSNSAAG